MATATTFRRADRRCRETVALEMPSISAIWVSVRERTGPRDPDTFIAVVAEREVWLWTWRYPRHPN